MSLMFYAQPYDLAATGFYFEDAETFETKSRALKNDYGETVEEFEIQLIEAERLDIELFKALGIHQGNIRAFIATLRAWADWQKLNIILAVRECGYSFDMESDDPDGFDITVYYAESLKEFAEQFVDEGLFGDIPEHLENYIDMDAIAADLRHDYSETSIAGIGLIYRA